MPRPYNKQTLRDAAMICDALASNPTRIVDEVAESLGIRPSSTGVRLAREALDVVSDSIVSIFYEEVAPEAAEIIRSGWRIGEPLNLIKKDLTTDLCNEILKEHYTPESMVALAMQPSLSLTAIREPDGALTFWIDQLAGITSGPIEAVVPLKPDFDPFDGPPLSDEDDFK